MDTLKKARLELRIELLKRGTNFTDLAKKLGYAPEAFRVIISRWWGRKELPRGKLSRKIILDIKRFLHNNPPIVFPDHSHLKSKDEDKDPVSLWREDSRNIKGAGQ